MLPPCRHCAFFLKIRFHIRSFPDLKKLGTLRQASDLRWEGGDDDVGLGADDLRVQVLDGGSAPLVTQLGRQGCRRPRDSVCLRLLAGVLSVSLAVETVRLVLDTERLGIEVFVLSGRSLSVKSSGRDPFATLENSRRMNQAALGVDARPHRLQLVQLLLTCTPSISPAYSPPN